MSTIDTLRLMDSYILIISLMVAILILIGPRGFLKRRLSFGAPEDVEGSAIWAAGTLGRKITKLSKGTVKERRYSFFAVHSIDNAFTILQIHLKMPSPIHLLCVNKNSRIVDGSWQNIVTQEHLEPMVLEGDFPSYFRTYTSNHTQLDARELFEPKAMAYFVDYCQNFDFEIFGNSLIVAIHSSQTSQDTTLAFDDAQKLARLVETQIEGWSATTPQPAGYDPLMHFHGNQSKLDTDSYVRDHADDNESPESKN